MKDAEEEAAKGMKCLIIDPYNFIDRSSKVGARWFPVVPPQPVF